MPALSIQGASSIIPSLNPNIHVKGSPLHQAFNSFMDNPSVGSWDRYLLALNAAAPFMGFGEGMPNLAGPKGRKKKGNLFSADLSYQTSEIFGGNSMIQAFRLAMSQRPQIALPSSGQMLGQIYGLQSLGMRPGGIYPQGTLDALRSQQSYLCRLISQADQAALQPQSRGGPLALAYEGNRALAPLAAIRDSDEQLKKISSVVSKQYELEQRQASFSRGDTWRAWNTRWGRAVPPNMEGMAAPAGWGFYNIPPNNWGNGPRSPGGGWGGNNQSPNNFAWARGAMGPGGNGPPNPPNNWWGAAFFGGGGNGLGGAFSFLGGLSKNPYLRAGTWIAKKGAEAALAYAELGDIQGLLLHKGSDFINYKIGMYNIARATGGNQGVSEQLMKTFWAGYGNKIPGRDLRNWQLTYGVSPQMAQNLLMNFPVLPYSAAQDPSLHIASSIVEGLARAPFLPGFAGLPAAQTQSMLGRFATMFPRNSIWADPYWASSRLSPILGPAGFIGSEGLSRQAMISSSSNIIEQLIGAGAASLNPGDIFSQTVNYGALGTLGARTGMMQQSLIQEQIQSVGNIGSNVFQTYVAGNLAQKMRRLGIQKVLGAKYQNLVNGGPSAARLLADMQSLLSRGDMGGAMALMPALLNMAVAQDLMTQGGAELGAQLFPNNQAWQDIIGNTFAGTSMPNYLGYKTAPNGPWPGFISMGEGALGGQIPLGAYTKSLVFNLAQQQGINPAMVFAIMNQESTFRQYNKSGGILRSSAGAMGLMQVMPEAGNPLYSPASLSTPGGNILAGISRLKEYYYGPAHQDMVTALAMYNVGPKNYETNPRLRAQGIAYANQVLNKYKAYSEAQNAGVPPNMPSKELQLQAQTGAQQMASSEIWAQVAEKLNSLASISNDAAQSIYSAMQQLFGNAPGGGAVGPDVSHPTHPTPGMIPPNTPKTPGAAPQHWGWAGVGPGTGPYGR